MLIVDRLILDPAEFLPSGAELDLAGAGFRILDGDFGDADVELEMVRQALGETPTSYHPPNTVTTLKLGVREEGEADLPTAAYTLAQKIGEINTPGTEHWLRRDFDYEAGGKFAGPLGKRVYKATLQGLGGWQRGESPDVTLTLLTGPYWYSLTEDESEVFTETEARELIFELAEVLGTAPGLIRVRVTNDGEEDWHGLILAGESRDMAQDATADTTAALAYDAADLTLKGGSTDIGGGVIEHASITAGWLTILGSEIDGVGHMTHKGVRRLWIRAEDPGTEAGDVQLRLRWRALGSLNWSENAIVPTPLVDAYQFLDLGECRPEQAAVGGERWEFQLQARAVSGAGKIRIHRVVPAPTEQYMVLRAPDVSQGAELQSSKSPETAENDSSAGGTAWTNFNNVKASDNSYATIATEVDHESKESQYLLVKKLKFAIPEGATVVGLMPSVERKASGKGASDVIDLAARIVKGGVIGSTDKADAGKWPASDTVKVYGSSSDLWGETWTASDINAEGFGFALRCTVTQRSSGSVTTASVDAITITVYYTEAADENRICFATRSIELRSDGVSRQHPEDDVSGQIIPEGFLPYASPSGLEGRKSRFIVIPTQGDLGELADSGDNALSAQALTRAGYLVAREAA